jgi:ubiquinone/menaquinone biosynthesis C-methylase UbiE
MTSPDTDKVFSGSIAKFYETYLVPLIFEPYAADLANRLASRPLTRVLEIAAGTGVVTRALASLLPEGVSIVATDLNQPMLDHASALGTKRPVEWRQADAMQLPFQDETVFGGTSSAQVGRRFHFQHVGSDQGKRIRGHRDDGTRIPIS